MGVSNTARRDRRPARSPSWTTSGARVRGPLVIGSGYAPSTADPLLTVGGFGGVLLVRLLRVRLGGAAVFVRVVTGFLLARR